MSFESDVTTALETLITSMGIGVVTIGYVAPEEIPETEIDGVERWLVYAVEEETEALDYAQTKSNLLVTVLGVSKGSTREAMSAKLDSIVTALRADPTLGQVADDLTIPLKQTYLESQLVADYRSTVGQVVSTVELTY